jgi:hypothetical protein
LEPTGWMRPPDSDDVYDAKHHDEEAKDTFESSASGAIVKYIS